MSPPPRASTSHVLDLHVLGTVVRVDLAGMSQTFVEQFRTIWDSCLAEPAPHVAQRQEEAGGLAVTDVPPERTVRVSELAQTSAAGADSPAAADRRRRQEVLVPLTQEVTRVAIRAQAGLVLMLHAGALAHPETGAAIVYVAPGGTGKTTLSRECGRGLAYVTDECVAITEAGDILPYPKPLSIRRSPSDATKDEHAPGDLGLEAPRVTPWVAGMVVIRRDGDVGEPPRRTQLDTLDAIELLAPETSSLGQLERPLHRLADLIAATGGMQVVSYDEATSLRPLVDEVTRRVR